MPHLVRQRVKYLVEFGGVYPTDEPASKNFVLKWFLLLAALDLLRLLYLLVN
jgi:hypothetical protein